MEREPNTEYVLSLSYGKDSLACLGAIEELGWPLDRIIHAEVWATDDIPADLPPMVSFKNHADEIIRERFGIEVEHLCATRNGEKLTYEKLFYHIPKRKNGGNFKTGSPAGFPYTKGAWCNDRLKTNPLDATSNSGGESRWLATARGGCGATSMLKRSALRLPLHNRELVQETQRRVLSSASLSSRETGVPAISNAGFSTGPIAQGAKTNIVQYLGIAADEPERIERHTKPGFKMPLVEIGWDEAYCRKWCEERDLLSPIYTTATRGGVLVLSQPGYRSASVAAENLPRPLEVTAEMGQRQSYHLQGRRSYSA